MRLTKVKAKNILPDHVAIKGKRDFFNSDYEGWKKLRNEGIGGSDIGAILGLNKYKTPIDVYLSKTGQGEEFEGNFKTDYGHWQEPHIAERFARAYKGKYEVYDFGYTLKNGYLMANVDRVLYDIENDRWGILEIKTGGEQQESKWEIEEMLQHENGSYVFRVVKSPDSYYAQTQLYLETTKFEFAIIAGTIGQKYIESPAYERNKAEGHYIRQVATEFYESYVMKNKIPPCDGTSAYSDYIKSKYSASIGIDETIDLSVDGENSVSEYLRLKKEIKASKEALKKLEIEQETHKQILQLEMGEYNLAEGPTGRVKKTASPRLYMDEDKLNGDIVALKEKHPELFENGLLQEDYKTRAVMIERFTVALPKGAKKKAGK